MQENHNDQPIELTYPVEIQFINPPETDNSDQPRKQDPDREQNTESLPPHTSAANERERETITEFLKEECACIRRLKRLLEMVDDNTATLHSLFEDSPVDPDINWGELNWGPMPQWEQLPPPPQE